MQELVGNIWDHHQDGWIVVTTNGIIKSNGDAVMGAGIALEAARKFPDLPRQLGDRLRVIGVK
jgi:hypothetical protein